MLSIAAGIGSIVVVHLLIFLQARQATATAEIEPPRLQEIQQVHDHDRADARRDRQHGSEQQKISISLWIGGALIASCCSLAPAVPVPGPARTTAICSGRTRNRCRPA